jgi:DNA-binding HxlR family transcriptional regulator
MKFISMRIIPAILQRIKGCNSQKHERRFPMKERCFILMARESTWIILGYLNDHEYTEYNDLLKYATPYSLNRTLKELLDYDLIRYYCHAETGLNYLVLTKRGKNFYEAIKELEEALQKSERR